MKGGWLALRASNQASDRELAMALLFAPAATRDLLADQLSLAIEAETALRLASEPMLAAIRLQWWAEAIETGRHDSVPLMQRLVGHMESGALSADYLTTVVGLWQDRLTSAPEDAGSCWGGMMAMMLPDKPAAAEQVGRALVEADAVVGDEALHLLATGQSRWAWMLGVLARHRRHRVAPVDDPLMVWRMVGWRFGIRRPSSGTTSR